MKISVPANLLLFGEYAVTLAQGRGIALACNRFCTIDYQKAEKLKITSYCHGKQFGLNDDRSFLQKFPLIACIFEEVMKYLANRGIHYSTPALSLTLNTSAFYTKQGEKIGFGSSAAMTVGLTFALLNHFYERPPHLQDELFPLALAIHRKYQGGFGSGYDIAASLFGNVGRFTGGLKPLWESLTPASWMRHLYLVQGSEKTVTKDALHSFNRFCHNQQVLKSSFLSKSNALVDEIAKCRDFSSATTLLQKSIALNQWIQGQIGLRSQSPFDTATNFAVKPLGAGSDIGLLLLKEGSKSFEPLTLSQKGLTWQL